MRTSAPPSARQGPPGEPGTLHGALASRAAGLGFPRSTCPRSVPAEAARRRPSRRPAGGGRDRPGAPLHAPVADELRRRHRLLPAGVVHHEVQPEGRRDGRGPARVPADAPAPARRHRAGSARAALAARAGAVRDHRHGARHPAAARRRLWRDDRPADHAGLPRRARGRAHEGRHPGLRARHEPRQRARSPASRRCRCRRTRAAWSTSEALEKLVRRRGRRAHAHEPEHARAVRGGHRANHRDRARASAASCTTTARTSTRSSAGAGPATWASTSCTSTRTRRSPRRTAGEGRAPGPVGVVERLVPFLPVAAVERDERRVRSGSTTTGPRSIGRMHGFHGNVGVLVRAYAYVFAPRRGRAEEVERARGAQRELPRVARRARTTRWRTRSRPCTSSSPRRARLKERYDVRAMDVAKRRDRPRVPPLHGVLPARGGGGHDGRADRDRDEGDARGLRRGPPPGRGRGAPPTPTSCTRPPVTTPVRRLDEARAARHLKLRW